jgi:predicted transcriptional regulator
VIRLTDEAKAELAELATAGKLSRHEVWARAVDPESALHPYFEWDSNVAAFEYQLQQAAQLIARVKVTVEQPPDRLVSVRAYAKVPSLGRSVPVEEALADWRDELEVQARRDFRAWRSKYRHLGATLDAIIAEPN